MTARPELREEPFVTRSVSRPLALCLPARIAAAYHSGTHVQVRRPGCWRYRLRLALIGVSTFGCHTLSAQLPADSALRLSSLARTHYEQGRPDSALYYFCALLPLVRAIGNRADEAIILSNIGALYSSIGQRDSALFYLRASLPLARAVGDRSGEATTLNLIGAVYGSVGQLDSALFYSRASLPLVRAVGDRPGEATTLSIIATVYSNFGQRDSALYYLRAALRIRRAVGDRAGEAKTLNDIGAVYHDTGHRDSALYYLRAALPLARAVDDRAGEARTLTNIGRFYDAIGQRDSALYYYRATLPITRAVGDRATEARTLNNIGLVYDNIEQRDSALFYQREALLIRRAIGDRAGEAVTLSNIGAVYRRIGVPDSALYYFRASLLLARAAGSRASQAGILSNIGVLYHDIGQRDSALFYLREALPIRRAIGDPAGEATTLSSIAVLYASGPASRANSARALAYFDSAAARSAVVRAQSGGDVSAIAFAETERSKFQDWARTWIDLAGRETGAVRDAAINSALAAAERGRAQGLRDLLMRAANSPVHPADVPNTASAPAGATLPLARGLAASDTIAGANLAAEGHLALAPLRQSRTSLLYYLLFGDSLTIWTLNPTGELRLLNRQSLTADSLAALVTMLRRGVGADKARGGMARSGAGGDTEQESTSGLSRGVKDVEQSPAAVEAAARALSAQLLPSELLRDVPAGSELVIVPQGVLGLIPFAALTAPGDSIPLGVRYALRYSPSLRALSDVGREPLVGNLQLIVGDPSMPTVTDASGVKVRLRDLPAAKLEGANVAQRFGAHLLTAEAGTETAVREQLPKARVVHLATHGLAFGSAARVRDSYVALAPDSQNDGLLTIGELLDDVPPLTADLVVLSACQTGLGDLKQAEGTVGFQRAFLAKGARSILVSLWSVDDKATALLMDSFYTHWLGPDRKPSKSKAEALRQAQSDVRSTKGYESPRYWAAFQLVGAR